MPLPFLLCRCPFYPMLLPVAAGRMVDKSDSVVKRRILREFAEGSSYGKLQNRFQVGYYWFVVRGGVPNSNETWG
ncbi:hypothetical protein GCM10010918_49400 [Paenibacillus radicis (ex Gao et al. 2016)]|uniref:Uncharacterized protein n=1 Tax=Paenibacillus radicis (ex Gao et al. 2016) TaxID=1737354 RepID=A0A917HPJ2_9BACL|nr:hypothetical protein GCM10010918_49400 [Paenibacillus radicis (ex Gao et al. 2016)]